jgi:uncharacterized protein (TIGR02594 family)
MRAVVNHVPPKSEWPRWMLTAEKEIGTRETPSGLSDNPRILQYQRATRLDEQALGDETAWCAAFVSFCLQESGCVNPRYALARNYLKYGTAVIVPQFGDIMVFSRGENEKRGHVCFFVLDLGADFEVLGGNQRQSVCYGHESKATLLGIRRPSELKP